MFRQLKKITLGNWILIGMILGLIVGLFLNLYVDNNFIKDFILMDNVFYLGGNIFIRLMKMLVVPLVFCSIVNAMSSISDFRIYATALSEEDILELYHTSATIDNKGNIYARELVEI